MYNWSGKLQLAVIDVKAAMADRLSDLHDWSLEERRSEGRHA